MTTKDRKLVKLFNKYQSQKKSKKIFGFFKSFMPEIIFRTTKLEGEKITRRAISTLF